MKILGLITEYNPFHNGHLYHLNMSKKITNATHTVAVMSGNFLQRGEPAIVDKWERAKMAVKSGIDLVIELPALYACSTAEIFAFGAVSLFNNLGIINCISFGSETGKLNPLMEISDILVHSPPAFSSMLKNYINSGFAFPVARSKAVIKYLEKIKNYGTAELASISNIMENPNNILGIEYLKAIKRLNSPIVPYTVGRKSACYNNKTISQGPIASATAIREHILSNKPLADIRYVLPASTFSILLFNIDNGFAPVFNIDFEKPILAVLRRSNLDDIKNIFDVAEGLENRIYRCSIKVNTLPELYNCIKSKRYTLTRIQRILIHILLNVNRNDIFYCNNSGGPQYARVLAFNKKGRELLRAIKTVSHIPVISNLKYYHPQNKAARKMLDIDIRATNIYSLAFKNKTPVKAPLDYTTSPHYEDI